MKKIVFFICMVSLSLSAFADIIVTKSNGNIENVTILEITETEIVYKQDGVQRTIPYNEVEAIMYDDGRYVTLPNRNYVNSTTENDFSGNEHSNYTNRIQQDNKGKSDSEVKQAFKKAGEATKDAFKTLFKSNKSKESDTENAPDSSASNDNW
ncbi:MAG: hypothetical protein IKZ56_07965 [Bacteroidales bacterium]|nr:hypothetical protein [Bacteroidales bacterium]